MDNLLAGTLFLPKEIHRVAMMSSVGYPYPCGNYSSVKVNVDSGEWQKLFTFAPEWAFTFTLESLFNLTSETAFNFIPEFTFTFDRNPQKGGVTTGHVRVPVYVDLMQLPYDATPVDFFQLVLDLAKHACAQYLAGITIAMLKQPRSFSRTLEDFRSSLLRMRDASGSDLHFVFLLDEAKRILAARFPRGFQDNLFALMFGDAAGPYSFVLVGAQELYKLSEDSTSPIGSRATKCFVCNLQPEAIGAIIRTFQPDVCAVALLERTSLISRHAGGHAGLTVALSRRFADLPEATADILEKAVESVRLERSELFQIWIHNLSPEARTVSETLLVNGHMRIRDVAARLRSVGLPPYRADRISEELQFTGIAVRDRDQIISVNGMYTDTAREYVVTERGVANEQEVWALIREVETALRCLIRTEFDKKWAGMADDQIRKVLGEESWKSISAMRAKSERSYGGVPRLVLAEILNFTYLGQLGDLMKANVSWSLFKDMFRDKRELEDIMKDVAPVRNDCAHFRAVPDRELDRCKLRCEDLLAIVTKRYPTNQQ